MVGERVWEAVAAVAERARCGCRGAAENEAALVAVLVVVGALAATGVTAAAAGGAARMAIVAVG